jgi:hypothetical protein
MTPVDKHGLGAGLAIGAMVAFIALGGLRLGLIALVVSLIALRRNMKGRGENTKKGMAIAGLPVLRLHLPHLHL